MSHAVSRAVPRASPPGTATICHFDCLFTHDLRRKQKRWQDGQLRFHTFNKRFMVYDDRGSFVGDGHWPGEVDDFTEGLELNLDRGLAIVQVDQYTGSSEQNLTELLDKRAREVEKRRAEAATRTPARAGGLAGTGNLLQSVQHRPLGSLVSNAGPVGRASIPQRSPYEMRKTLPPAESEERTVMEPPARERWSRPSPPPSKLGHAQNLFGTRLTLTTGSLPLSTVRRKPIRFDGTPQVQRSSADSLDEEEGQRSISNTALSRRQDSDLFPFSAPEKRVMDKANSRRKTQREDEEEEEHRTEQRGEQEEREGDESHEAILMASSTQPYPKSATSRTKRNKMLQSGQGLTRPVHDSDGALEEEEDVAIAVSTPRIPSDDENQLSRGVEKRTSEKIGRDFPVEMERVELSKRQSTKSKSCKEKKAAEEMEEQLDRPAEKKTKKQKSRRTGQTDLEDGDQRAVAQKGTEELVAEDLSYSITEKRTQLRSRPRPKRGLLMLSEFTKETHDPGDSGKPIRGTSQPNRDDEIEAAHHIGDPMPVACDEAESDLVSSKVPKRQRVNVEEQDEPGIKVKRLARKSIKSKEVFGLPTPVIDLSTAPFQITAHPIIGIESGDDVESTGATQKQTQKIRNSATRGKKAARKEDAAGPALQPALPFDAVIVTARSMLHGGKAFADDTSGPNADAGMSGAWSRHAEDLLGMTRPARK